MRDRRRGAPAARLLIGLATATVLLFQLVPVGLAAPSGTVSGVLQVEGMLTANAVAVVTVLDQGAAPTEALIIGQQRAAISGTGSISFAVRYDPARIDLERPYVFLYLQRGATPPPAGTPPGAGGPEPGAG
jgi:uncharacterized lipoprotein YbaY